MPKCYLGQRKAYNSFKLLSECNMIRKLWARKNPININKIIFLYKKKDFFKFFRKNYKSLTKVINRQIF